ncbi:phosphotransferase [Leucobacter sp. wl10]|uniref:phosphotransferase n=1 Tax=Leucobacter sp. wl10 TaxID=2304677 RepID=UPI0013C2EBFB|nr:phosphotransferase [Leucobacter sp. wl10]
MSEPRTAAALMDGGGLTGDYVSMGSGEARAVVRDVYGLDAQVLRLATEKDDTFRVDINRMPRFVMKVANPGDDRGELDFVRQLHQHVIDTDPSIPIPRFRADLSGRSVTALVDEAGQNREVHLIEYLPGTTLDELETDARQRELVGEALAKLRIATESFAHPCATRPLAWDARRALELTPLLAFVQDRRRRAALAAGLARFADISAEVNGMRMQVLHNDFSKSNLLGDPSREEFLTGVFDFGDSVTTTVAVDVSTALLNQLPRDLARHPVDDPFAAGKDLLRGYLRLAALTDRELSLVPHLVMARVIARALITTRRALLFPENVGYIMRNTQQGWAQLEWFLDRPFDEVSEILDAFRA